LEGKDGIYATSALDKTKKEIILKIVNTSDAVKKVVYTFNGLTKEERKGIHILLKSDNMDLENTLDQPDAVVPSTNEITVSGNTFEADLAPESFNLYVIKI
jgi:alpha-L-arabinofuranosidase